MKHFAYFIAGVVVASLVQSIVPMAHAWSYEEQKKKDIEAYREYKDCREKEKSKYATYECLRLNPLGFRSL